MQLDNARDVKNVIGRRKKDELDAVWLAKLTEKGRRRRAYERRARIWVRRDDTSRRED